MITFYPTSTAHSSYASLNVGILGTRVGTFIVDWYVAQGDEYEGLTKIRGRKYILEEPDVIRC
jgi:hypothetical protein